VTLEVVGGDDEAAVVVVRPALVVVWVPVVVVRAWVVVVRSRVVVVLASVVVVVGATLVVVVLATVVVVVGATVVVVVLGIDVVDAAVVVGASNVTVLGLPEVASPMTKPIAARPTATTSPTTIFFQRSTSRKLCQGFITAS